MRNPEVEKMRKAEFRDARGEAQGIRYLFVLLPKALMQSR
jgi:hypothetical protein